MKACTISTLYLTIATATSLVVAGSTVAMAQQSQSSAERPRLFQRFRDDTRTAPKSNEASPATKPGTHAYSGVLRPSRPMPPNTAAIAQQKSSAHPTPSIGNPPPAPVAVQPALRPPNRLAVPTLAPQLQSVPNAVAAPTSNSSSHQLGISLQDKDEAVKILSVQPGSSAHRDGLRPGDLIRSIGGVPLQSQAEFYQVAGLMQSGDQIELVVSRAGNDETILLSIGQPQDIGAPAEAANLTLRDSQKDPSVPLNRIDDSLSPAISEGMPNSPFAPGPNAHRHAHLESTLRESLQAKERQLLELQREIDAIRQQLIEVAQTQNFEIAR